MSVGISNTVQCMSMTNARLEIRTVDEGGEKFNKRLSHGLMRKVCHKLNVMNSAFACELEAWLQPSVTGKL